MTPAFACTPWLDRWVDCCDVVVGGPAFRSGVDGGVDFAGDVTISVVSPAITGVASPAIAGVASLANAGVASLAHLASLADLDGGVAVGATFPAVTGAASPAIAGVASLANAGVVYLADKAGSVAGRVTCLTVPVGVVTDGRSFLQERLVFGVVRCVDMMIVVTVARIVLNVLIQMI